MNSLYFVAAVAALAVSAHAKAGVLEEHPIDWYECGDKADGNYLHPYDCTRFISCSGGIASQRDCAVCHVHPLNCPTGRLVYDLKADACLWADQTTCGGSGEPDTTPAPTPEPTQSPTTEAPTDPELPVEGSDCNPDECIHHGNCDWYLHCTGGVWVREKCGDDLLWNPFKPDGSKHPHGGNCDLITELPKDLLEEYWKDCLECEWKELDPGSCTQEYFYRKHNSYTTKHETMSCSNGLVFIPAKETCGRCDEYGPTCPC